MALRNWYPVPDRSGRRGQTLLQIASAVLAAGIGAFVAIHEGNRLADERAETAARDATKNLVNDAGAMIEAIGTASKRCGTSPAAERRRGAGARHLEELMVLLSGHAVAFPTERFDSLGSRFRSFLVAHADTAEYTLRELRQHLDVLESGNGIPDEVRSICGDLLALSRQAGRYFKEWREAQPAGPPPVPRGRGSAGRSPAMPHPFFPGKGQAII